MFEVLFKMDEDQKKNRNLMNLIEVWRFFWNTELWQSINTFTANQNKHHQQQQYIPGSIRQIKHISYMFEYRREILWPNSRVKLKKKKIDKLVEDNVNLFNVLNVSCLCGNKSWVKGRIEREWNRKNHKTKPPKNICENKRNFWYQHDGK